MVARGGLSSDELSFQRLLERTKKLSRANLPANVWKVAAATVYLENLFARLQNDSSLDHDLVVQYGREVHQMKVLVEAEQQKTTQDKLRVLEKIPTRFPEVSQVKVASDGDGKKTDDVTSLQESSAGVRVRSRAVYKADLRKELLSSSRGHVDKEAADSNDSLTRHEDLQEVLANQLLGLTTSLKQNMTLAGSVIRDDNKRLTTMSQQVDSNREKLSIESSRLSRHAYKCGFDCMLIFVALFLFWSFLVMVVIMKVFPKRVVN